MPEQNSPSLIKIIALVGLIGLLGLVGMGGLLFAGWKMMGASSRPGAEESGGVVINGGQSEGPAATFGKQEMEGKGWLAAVNNQLASLTRARKNQGKQQVETEQMAFAPRPVVASQPITVDERAYQQYIKRKDVLVMVAYYADW